MSGLLLVQGLVKNWCGEAGEECGVAGVRDGDQDGGVKGSGRQLGAEFSRFGILQRNL